MDFSTTDEHREPRPPVTGIAAEFGNGYYIAKAEGRQFTSEMWQALGSTATSAPTSWRPTVGRPWRAWSIRRSSARRPPRRALHRDCCWSPAPSDATLVV